jgi:hypothetical protein
MADPLNNPIAIEGLRCIISRSCGYDIKYITQANSNFSSEQGVNYQPNNFVKIWLTNSTPCLMYPLYEYLDNQDEIRYTQIYKQDFQIDFWGTNAMGSAHTFLGALNSSQYKSMLINKYQCSLVGNNIKLLNLKDKTFRNSAWIDRWIVKFSLETNWKYLVQSVGATKDHIIINPIKIIGRK